MFYKQAADGGGLVAHETLHLPKDFYPVKVPLSTSVEVRVLRLGSATTRQSCYLSATTVTPVLSHRDVITLALHYLDNFSSCLSSISIQVKFLDELHVCSEFKTTWLV